MITMAEKSKVIFLIAASSVWSGKNPREQKQTVLKSKICQEVTLANIWSPEGWEVKCPVVQDPENLIGNVMQEYRTAAVLLRNAEIVK